MTTVSVTDLTNAKTDVDHIAAIATSTALTATDRLGTTKKTLQGAINSISAITDRGTWVTATAYAVKDIVLDTGVYYICITAHTSGATFAGDAAKWRVYQGDLGAYHSVDVVNDIRSNDFSSRKMIRIATERGNPVYYLDSADTTSADDDFLVIVDNAGNRFKLVHNGTIDVRWAGAKGDGITDDTVAIQKAIASLPLNVGDIGVISPKGFAQGGIIFVPRGRYKVTSTITMQRGLNLIGEGREASQFVSFTPVSVFKYSDSGRYIQDEVVIKSLSIWQDASVTATGGAGIEIFMGDVSVESIGCVIENVYIEGTYRGLLLGAGVWCSVKNVNASKCLSYGFDVRFTASAPAISTSTTSTSFINCYASLCFSGFRIERGAYCSFVSCASDSNTAYGYELEDGLGHSFLACGAEENGVGGLLLTRTEGVLVNMFVVYGSATGTKHGAVLDQAKNTVFHGGRFNSVTPSGGYGIRVLNAAGNITVSGLIFDGNYVGNEIDSQFKVLFLDAAGGLVGGGTLTKNRWAIGAIQQPETDTKFGITGVNESTTYNGMKVATSFSGAGGVRNAQQWVQFFSENTAVSYPLCIGTFVANATKGASATHQRTAGVYVVDQTTGTTANANVMIDEGQGTVPAGNWSIYNGSSKNNYQRSGTVFGQVTAASVPNSTLFVDSSDGILKFKDSVGVLHNLY